MEQNDLDLEGTSEEKKIYEIEESNRKRNSGLYKNQYIQQISNGPPNNGSPSSPKFNGSPVRK